MAQGATDVPATAPALLQSTRHPHRARRCNGRGPCGVKGSTARLVIRLQQPTGTVQAMSLDKDRKRAKKHKASGDSALILLMGLAGIQERLLACIINNDQRKAWDDEIEAQMELIHQAIKDSNDG